MNQNVPLVLFISLFIVFVYCCIPLGYALNFLRVDIGQPPAQCFWGVLLTGLQEEFVFIGRLDNLAMSFLSLQALIDSTSGDNALAEEVAVKAIALFDHEEVGSASAQGMPAPASDSIRYSL